MAAAPEPGPFTIPPHVDRRPDGIYELVIHRAAGIERIPATLAQIAYLCGQCARFVALAHNPPQSSD